MGVKAANILKEGTSILQKAEITDYEYDARVLLEWICGIKRIDLILEPFMEVDEEKAERFLSAIHRRESHEPLQYLLGEWEFMGFPFLVNPSVLIPRQDTEVLIEWMLEEEAKAPSKDTALLDVCTGSGCIAISMDLLWKDKTGFDLHTEALDISEQALCTAKKNNELNHARVQFYQSNMFEKIQKRYDIIVSNPPYIPSKVVDGLMAEVVRHEPRLALDGMEDGLHFYRILAKQGKKYLKPGGRMYFEIGHDQGGSVPELLEKEGFTQIEVRQDLAGNDRCVRAVFC